MSHPELANAQEIANALEEQFNNRPNGEQTIKIGPRTTQRIIALLRRPPTRSTSSGFPGIYKRISRRGSFVYVVQARHNGKRLHLYSGPSLADAQKVREHWDRNKEVLNVKNDTRKHVEPFRGITETA